MSQLDPAAIDALLPQTQCTLCGHAGCLPYAEAIAAGAAPINRCPPGGEQGIRALAALTGQPFAPLDPAHGVEKPRVLAVIDEAACIGCTICIQKCPVDAIVGAAKLMHTVIADECTGCELCIAPCPVDCILLVAAPASHPALARPRDAANFARRRHRARLARLARHAAARTVEARDAECREQDADAVDPAIGTAQHKQRAIAAARARARARRADEGTR